MDMKKKRTGNFTLTEKLNLVAKLEMVQNRNIIENKKTDGVTSKQKEEYWHRIANELNSEGTGEYRNITSLKSCWENLKKKTRKHYAAIRQERFATGGGTMDIKDDPLLDRVRAIIQPSVDGLVNIFDSDATEGNEVPVMVQQFANDNDYEDEDEFMIVESLEETQQSNWDHWNPKMLRQKKSQELDARQLSSEQLLFADVEAALVHQRSTSQPQPSASKSFSSTTQPCTSASQPLSFTPQPPSSVFQPSSSTPQPRPSASQPSSTPQPRPSASQRPSRIWNSKRRSALATTTAPLVNATTRNKHFTALAESKLELVEMMKEDMRAKSAIEMQILQTQLEKEQLDVELLKHELQQRKRRCLDTDDKEF